jgi:ribosomal protein S18 acetylase RimI-like enzyme
MSTTNTDLLIRLAGPDDASAVSAVLSESFAEYRSLYTEAGFNATTPSPDVIQTRLSEGPMWVAIFRGVVVGTVAALQTTDALYIRGMAVLPTARGTKLGEQLLNQVESYAIAEGFTRLRLSTTPFLARAIGLYLHYGFVFTDTGPDDLFGTPLRSMEKQPGPV